MAYANSTHGDLVGKFGFCQSNRHNSRWHVPLRETDRVKGFLWPDQGWNEELKYEPLKGELESWTVEAS